MLLEKQILLKKSPSPIFIGRAFTGDRWSISPKLKKPRPTNNTEKVLFGNVTLKLILVS